MRERGPKKKEKRRSEEWTRKKGKNKKPDEGGKI